MNNTASHLLPVAIAKLLLQIVLVTVAAISMIIAHPVMAATYQIMGKVTNQAGTAIIGATIEVINPASEILVSAVTDNQGQYALQVPAGSYWIEASGNTDGSSVPSRWIMCACLSTPTTINQNLTFDLAVPSYLVRVHVQDVSGNAVANVEVKTDASG